MAVIYYEKDADLSVLDGLRVAVVGYGNQGRSWALNLRDSGVDPLVCVRADSTKEKAEADGFSTQAVDAAGQADVICLILPDDVIPTIELTPSSDALVIVASGYTLAFARLDPVCDAAMVAPRMLGPEVRRCYVEGRGFITAVGIHRDATGLAKQRTLAIARAIGGLRQGAIELTPRQEAVLDLAVEQALAPALGHVSRSFVQVMLENGIPIEAVVTELVVSGEVERPYRLVRLKGGAAQMPYHSPTSQYGQLSRAERFSAFDLRGTMTELVDYISSGEFADEWDLERDEGYPNLQSMKEKALSAQIRAFEADLRSRLGENAVAQP